MAEKEKIEVEEKEREDGKVGEKEESEEVKMCLWVN